MVWKVYVLSQFGNFGGYLGYMSDYVLAQNKNTRPKKKKHDAVLGARFVEGIIIPEAQVKSAS